MDVPSKVGLTFAGVGLVVLGGAISAEFISQAKDDVSFREVTIPDRPCANEDGPAPCFWDAGVRGSDGASFWLTRQGERVRVHYLDPRTKERDKPPRDREPYGGCDEAYLYPKSSGAAWCRAHGYDGHDVPTWLPFRDVEGHHGCEIRVGKTSLVRCEDGFMATS